MALSEEERLIVHRIIRCLHVDDRRTLNKISKDSGLDRSLLARYSQSSLAPLLTYHRKIQLLDYLKSGKSSNKWLSLRTRLELIRALEKTLMTDFAKEAANTLAAMADVLSVPVLTHSAAVEVGSDPESESDLQADYVFSAPKRRKITEGDTNSEEYVLSQSASYFNLTVTQIPDSSGYYSMIVDEQDAEHVSQAIEKPMINHANSQFSHAFSLAHFGMFPRLEDRSERGEEDVARHYVGADFKR